MLNEVELRHTMKPHNPRPSNTKEGLSYDLGQTSLGLREKRVNTLSNTANQSPNLHGGVVVEPRFQ